MRIFCLIIYLLCFISTVKAQSSVAINNFIIKEHLLKNEKLAIIATDENEKPLETVNGTFLFSINGLKQELIFHDGIAVAPNQIAKSSFVYLKHRNDIGTYGKLYFVIKKEQDLNPIKINWLFLILIPLILVIIASMFRKFILFAGILLVIIFFFNQSKGLDISTFLETIFDGLKSVV